MHNYLVRSELCPYIWAINEQQHAMNAPYTPSAKAIENATKTIGNVAQVIGVTKVNKRTFVMSFVSVRMGMKRLMDYTFTNDTGRLTYMKEVEHTYIG